MNSRLLVFALCSLLFLPAKAELTVPKDSVPEDHLAWFGLRGAVLPAGGRLEREKDRYENN